MDSLCTCQKCSALLSICRTLPWSSIVILLLFQSVVYVIGIGLGLGEMEIRQSLMDDNYACHHHLILMNRNLLLLMNYYQAQQLLHVFVRLSTLLYV